jgi:hypothetical protein
MFGHLAGDLPTFDAGDFGRKHIFAPLCEREAVRYAINAEVKFSHKRIVILGSVGFPGLPALWAF